MRFEHVILIGVDGAGSYFKKANIPNIERIFKDGNVNHHVLTAEPTISAECWGSMLIGVDPEVHGLTNDIVSTKPYDTESQYPTIFRLLREKYPEACLASFCNWSPINAGIVEGNLDVIMETGGDGALTDKICGFVKENKPMFFFIQFDEVDGAGHCHQYGSEKHLEQIGVEDGYIGRIFEAYEKAGIADSTLFIVTADHGGIGHSHGGSSDEEKYVMAAFRGKGVRPGSADLMIRDMPAIVAEALGIDIQRNWAAKLPKDLFE